MSDPAEIAEKARALIAEGRALLEKATPGPIGILPETNGTLIGAWSTSPWRLRTIIAQMFPSNPNGTNDAIWLGFLLAKGPALLALAEKAQRMEGARTFHVGDRVRVLWHVLPDDYKHDWKGVAEKGVEGTIVASQFANPGVTYSISEDDPPTMGGWTDGFKPEELELIPLPPSGEAAS